MMRERCFRLIIAGAGIMSIISTSNMAIGRASPTPSGVASNTGPVTETHAGTTGPATIVTFSSTAKATASPETTGRTDFATLAKQARATLDAGYQASGKSSDQVYMYGTESDWNSVFALDRRALYAVRSNEDGQFTAKEQDIAKSLMAKQQERAMGLDTPTGKLGLDLIQGFKDGVKFLDGVSDEEKRSFEWAEQRAGAQYGYEAQTRLAGQEPENLDSTNLIVKMIKAGLDALTRLDDPSKKLSDTAEYKQAQKLSANQTSGDALQRLDVAV